MSVSRNLVSAFCAAGLWLALGTAAPGADPATAPTVRRVSPARAEGRTGLFAPGALVYPGPNGGALTREQLPAALKGQEQHLAEARERLAAAQAQVRDLQEVMRSLSGRTEASPEVLRQALVKLEDEQQAMELESAASQARRTAVEQALAEATVRTKKSVETDDAVREMAKVVEAREASLKQLRQAAASGLATPQDVSAAEAALAESKARLAVQREQAASAAGGDGLSALNRDLITLFIAEREREARLKFIGNRVERLGQALRRTNELEKAQSELAKADKAATSAELTVNKLRQVLLQAELDQQIEAMQNADRDAPAKNR